MKSLQLQTRQLYEVVVIDASRDARTEEVMLSFTEAKYLRTDVGYGHMTASRNLGLLNVSGDVIAFIDDDAFPHPEWCEEITAPYSDPTVGGVGGRALNRQPGEDTEGLDEVGRLDKRGKITGYFAANTGDIVEVDHLIGCNMSWRKEILAKLGGLRDDYPGTEVREETDIALRVRSLGYRLLFNPAAVVDHLGGPQQKGKRFDIRYAYYAQRNHVALLIRNYGIKASIIRCYLADSTVASFKDFVHRIGAAFLRSAAFICGTITGIAAGLWLILRHSLKPFRIDKTGQKISLALESPDVFKKI